MEQKNFFLKTAIVLAFAFAWMNLAQVLFPQFFPQKKNAPQPAPAAAQPAEDPAAADPGGQPDRAERPLHAATDEETGADDSAAEPPAALEQHPHRIVELGSLQPDSAYFLKVTLTTAGAAIESVELNDPRYSAITNRKQPLKVVGNNPHTDLQTLETSIQQIDAQLQEYGTSLAEVDWEIVPDSQTENEVTFRYRAPDGTLEVRKHFHLNVGDPENRDGDPLGYQLQFDLHVLNLSQQPQNVVYKLQGPVGLPLEDEENSRTYIEVKAGTLEDPGAPQSVSVVTQTAGEIVKQAGKAEAGDPAAVQTWKSPLKYVGVDVQYFAALILPQGHQLQSRYFSEARPVLVRRNPQNEQWSDVSVQLTSETAQIQPGQSLDHSFQVFFGPKRSDLLEPLSAEGVQNFGWFAFISRGMLAVLNFFHHTLLAPYGIAIIMLTVVVRACMFPISRKMAQNQQRMKELQPKMQEIRNKYKDDQEKMAQAYREFMAKNNFNPLAGCLPMFLQLPIFFGLYQALYNSVDLRMARFLWIDNLAAPDQLFAFGFRLPLLGWTHFNLLPLITVVLFVLQQKMFMPPPTSEEQEMQYKMMNFFTIIIGFMFYRVPSGLCVYFIASSLWGIAERKLLVWTGATSPDEKKPAAIESGPGADDSGSGRKNRSSRRGGDGEAGTASPETSAKPPGLLQRLVEAADQAKNASSSPSVPRGETRSDKRDRRGRKTKPRR